jgi:tetratricopeptide (TPR) repeat protein
VLGRVTVAVLALATPAFAQEPPVEEDAAARAARQHYEAGITHYNLGEFKQAIDEFKKAYELSKKPRLLFNIAQAYRLDRQWSQAAYFYRTYLRLVPDAENREDVEEFLAEADREQAAQDTADRRARDGQLRDKAARNDAARRKRLRTAALITITGGVVLGGAGLYFAGEAADAADDLTALAGEGGMWSEAYAQIEQDGRRDDVIGTSLLVGAGAVILAGGALYVWGLLGEEPPARVTVTPSGAGGTVWFDFDF